MKLFKGITAIALCVIGLFSCQKDSTIRSEEPGGGVPINKTGKEHKDEGNVYTMNNQVGQNQVMHWLREEDGTLTFQGRFPTGGTGTGGGLGNQGALFLGDGVLLVVNPGSNTVSSMKITGSGLNLKSTVESGGLMPVSVTMHKGIVYVLNAGGTGNISGFKLGVNDKLAPIPNATRPLSSVTAGAAQISFVNNGNAVAITEKATNKIITYAIDQQGLPGSMNMISSNHPTPFGFGVGKNGNIFVSEAGMGLANASVLSSYNVANNGAISNVAGPLATGQTAICWVVINKGGTYAYGTNTGSNNISSFNINANTGAIGISNANAAATGTGPIDAAMSRESNYLYVLNSGSNNISVYSVSTNGSLSPIQTVGGLPPGANGIAAD